VSDDRPDLAVAPPASPRDPRPDAPLDTTRIRRFPIGARVLGLAALGALVVVAVVLAAVLGSAAVDGASDRRDDLSLAGFLNSQATAHLHELHALVVGPDARGGTSGADVEVLVRQIDATAPRIARLVGSNAFELERRASSADTREVEAARALVAVAEGASDDAEVVEEQRAFEAAARAHDRLDGAIAARRDRQADHVGTLRTRAFTVVVVVAAVGLGLLVAATRVVARSITLPLRNLGRAMRRFGDGDLRSRGAEAPDEVGTLARSFNVAASATAERLRDLTARAERGTQLRIIAEALDLALDEGDVHRIVEHAMGIIAPGRPMELLMSAPDSSALHQVAVNPNGGAPNCPVEDTTACPAIRRAAALTFEEPDAINSCPMLRERPSGPCSAVCVPVNAGGTLVGVLHATGLPGDPPPQAVRDQMITLAAQTGARIGSMRTLESTRVEATTDGLTGLANRRMLNATLADLLRTSTPFVLVVADLDHFKSLNDTYGHETGDRALQLFAQVLQGNVRGRDLVARYGGEEFVLVYPEMNVRLSMEVLERIRAALAQSVAETGIPPFTASFGVTHSSVGADIDTIIRVADAGLLMAKDLGRDRIVYSDADLAAEVFSGRGEDRPPDPDR
jgi:diguanylate cyclase (GGDEF)-like protein